MIRRDDVPYLPAAELVDLLDYRRRVAEMYRRVRISDSGGLNALTSFRESRDHLFARHPQSPLSAAQRRAFSGLDYYPYDPSLRFTAALEERIERAQVEVRLRDDGLLILEEVGLVHFEVAGRSLSLTVFWLRGYGGGLFLPFVDATSGQETYGGGRYLLDTLKGADLGSEQGRLVLDFNYAYNPSCAYHARWECPLAPPGNRLQVPIRAGEMSFRE